MMQEPNERTDRTHRIVLAFAIVALFLLEVIALAHHGVDAAGRAAMEESRALTGPSRPAAGDDVKHATMR